MWGFNVGTVQASTPFAWGPYISVGIVLLAGLIGWLVRSLLKVLDKHSVILAQQSIALAVLVSETKNDRDTVTKYHDEILEHKVALAELNEFRIDIEKRSFTMAEKEELMQAILRHRGN